MKRDLPSITMIKAMIAAKKRGARKRAGGRRAMLSDARLHHLYTIYRRGYSIGELAEVFDLPWYPIWSGFHRLGFKMGRAGGRRLRASIAKQVIDPDVILSPARVEELRREFLKLPKCKAGCRGYAERFVQAIYSDYRHHGEIIAPLAARWNRAEGTIGLLLVSLGLRERDAEMSARVKNYARVPGNGCFAKKERATPEKLKLIIARATKIAIPPELRWEFREWPMEKRGWFLQQLRARIKSPEDRPEKPFSSNVRPFDYTTPEAQAIKERLNAGLNSREAICRIDLASNGVIYKGELWYWAGWSYCKRGAWTPEHGRPQLNRAIWEEHNGPVPPKHLVYYRDGNPNNLSPGNLGLMSMNENARRNQAAALFRKSRERTALLLRRSQEGGEKHGLIETLKAA